MDRAAAGLMGALIAIVTALLWDRVPIGRDQNGSTVSISLVEQNALVGRIPGAGKTFSPR